MAETDRSGKVTGKARQARLADALRANLRRRKAQKRGRDAAQDDEQARAAQDAARGDKES
jgi:hypothetical protein